MNILITDSLRLAGCRYATSGNNKPLSLHYAAGKSYKCANNEYLMKDEAENADKKGGISFTAA